MIETPARAGVVHDLGYKRYGGVRRSQGTRYRVIMRNLIVGSWRGWLRMKLWFIAGLMTVVGISVALYSMLYIGKNPVVKNTLMGGTLVKWSEFLIPVSLDPMTMLAFVLGMTVVAGIIADDMRVGAFEFYFSRPLRPRDYVLGKMSGAAFVIGTLTLGGPLAVALTRLALSSGANVGAELHLIPKVLLAGAIATLLYTVVPLAISGLARKKAYTIAAWAAFYLVVGNTATIVADQTGTPAIAAIHIKACVMSIAYELFGVEFLRGMQEEVLPPVGVAVAASAAYVVISAAIVGWRIRQAESSGLGGG